MLLVAAVSVSAVAACLFVFVLGEMSKIRRGLNDIGGRVDSQTDAFVGLAGSFSKLSKSVDESNATLNGFAERWTLPNSVYPVGSELPLVGDDMTPVVTKRKRGKK